MKRNAIVRICMYSALIVLLLAVLAASLFGWDWTLRGGKLTEADVAESEEPVAVYGPVETDLSKGNATVTSQWNFRASPSDQATLLGNLYPGERVMITDIQDIMGQQWGYLDGEKIGWTHMDFVKLDDPSQLPAGSETEPGEANSVGVIEEISEVVTVMDIEWPSGKVVIEAVDGTVIRVLEEGRSGSACAKIHVTDKGRLKIRGQGISGANNLTITVPQDLLLNKLEISTASADVELRGLEVGELEIEGASGQWNLKDITAGELDVDTASGDVYVSGNLLELDYEGTSAHLTGVFQNHPKKLDLQTMSGDLDITLPDACGFTLSFQAAGGELTSDFATKIGKNGQVSGDGACKIQVESMSGNLNIRKAAA